MKKNLLLSWKAAFILLLLTGCKKDGVIVDTSNFNGIISQDTWRISSFTQRNEIKTSDFAGLNFAFARNGTLTITGAQSATGSWSYSPGVAGSYGNATTPATFTINIVQGSEFSKLDEAWKVSSINSTTLSLDHPEAAEDEHLVFTKQ